MKIIYNKWSTEATISDWYEAQEGNCLRCQLERESQTHVYQCRSENGKSTHLAAIKSFRNDMQRAKTIPMITDLLVSIIKENRMGYEQAPIISAYYSDQIKSIAKSVYDKQRKIGTSALVKGFLIVEWESLQNVCTNNANTSTSNVEWASRVIFALWSYSRQIWDERCQFIHATKPDTKKSLKTDELLRILNKEIAILKESHADYDTSQLIANIESKKKKAKNHTLYKWLDMIRHRKEAEKQRKQHDQTHRIRVQPITRWRNVSQDT